MKPLVSIIVPAYKTEAYLNNCIDSILNQKYKNIEIIIVDDGTPDRSGIIADEYQSKYPDLVKSVHTDNQGVTSARLKGVSLANGDWIGFVDGDDEIEEDLYQVLIDNAIKYDADISHCGYRTIVNCGERIHWFYNTEELCICDQLTGLRELITGEKIEPGLWNKLFKKSLFDIILKSDIMNKNVKNNEDFMMNYILFEQAAKSVYQDVCLYNYMARPDSTTRKSPSLSMIYDPVIVSEWILNRAPTQLKEEAWRRHLKCCVTAYNNLLVRNDYRDVKRLLNKRLFTYRNKWYLLRRSDLYRLIGMLYLPHLYLLLDSIYSKYFQIKKYE